MRVRVGIHGALGRMGMRLVQLVAEDPGLRLTAAMVRPGHGSIGEDIGALVGRGPMGVAVTQGVGSCGPVDVIIDFSLPAACVEAVNGCVARGIPVVVGTTGLSAAERGKVEDASKSVAILMAPNTSRAVNVLMGLVDQAAKALAGSAEIEIIERHHRTKKDAPSGTALRLAEIAGRRVLEQRDGSAGIDPKALIPTHSLRIADCPGEHTVVFGLMGETLELHHRAINRDGFARGALEAARFLAGKPAGLYSMGDLVIFGNMVPRVFL
jgi:4-hydroxy-tetrahydrodipicolinate reductase